jgi:tRNA uridine 5-carbamoylmethylation protein Kti12
VTPDARLELVRQGKVVVILRGLPGSGKSWLTHELYMAACVSKLRYDVCSADEYFTEWTQNLEKQVYNWTAAEIGNAHAWCRLNFRRAVYHGIEVVIVDNTNVNAKDVEFYYQHALDNNYRVELVEPDTEWRYNVEECAKRNKHNVPLEALQRMQTRWEPADVILPKLKEIHERAIRERSILREV